MLWEEQAWRRAGGLGGRGPGRGPLPSHVSLGSFRAYSRRKNTVFPWLIFFFFPLTKGFPKLRGRGRAAGRALWGVCSKPSEARPSSPKALRAQPGLELESPRSVFSLRWACCFKH